MAEIALFGGGRGHVIAVDGGQVVLVVGERGENEMFEGERDGGIEPGAGEVLGAEVERRSQIADPLAVGLARGTPDGGIVEGAGHGHGKKMEEGVADGDGQGLEAGGMRLANVDLFETDGPEKLETVEQGKTDGGIFWNGIKGKDVDADAAERPFDVRFEKNGAAVVDFQGTQGERAGRVAGDDGQGSGVGFGKERDEAVVVGAEHDDIDVVVPRNEALVADGPEKGAAREEEGEGVALAKGNECLEDVEFEAFQLFNGEGCASCKVGKFFIHGVGMAGRFSCENRGGRRIGCPFEKSGKLPVVEIQHGLAVGFGGEKCFGAGAGGGAAGGAEGGVLQERNEAVDEGGDIAGGGERVGGEGAEHVGDAVDTGGDDGAGVGEGFHDDAGIGVAAGGDEEDVDGRVDGRGVGEGTWEGDGVFQSVLADEFEGFAAEVVLDPMADDAELGGDGAFFDFLGDLEGDVDALAAGECGDESHDGDGVSGRRGQGGEGEGI